MDYKVNVFRDGTTEWSLHGKLHREDGPAYISSLGYVEWYLNGVKLTELEHFKQSPYYQSLPAEEQIYILLSISDQRI